MTQSCDDLLVHRELRVNALAWCSEDLDLDEVVGPPDAKERTVGEGVGAVLGDRHEAVAVLDRDGLTHRLVAFVEQCPLVRGAFAVSDVVFH